MKKYILLFMLFKSCGLSYGQNDSDAYYRPAFNLVHIGNNDSVYIFNVSAKLAGTIANDTIPCILVLIDTALRTEINEPVHPNYVHNDNKVYWVHGYRIRSEYYDEKYLNINKLPFSKSNVILFAY